MCKRQADGKNDGVDLTIDIIDIDCIDNIEDIENILTLIPS